MRVSEQTSDNNHVACVSLSRPLTKCLPKSINVITVRQMLPSNAIRSNSRLSATLEDLIRRVSGSRSHHEVQVTSSAVGDGDFELDLGTTAYHGEDFDCGDFGNGDFNQNFDDVGDLNGGGDRGRYSCDDHKSTSRASSRTSQRSRNSVETGSGFRVGATPRSDVGSDVDSELEDGASQSTAISYEMGRSWSCEMGDGKAERSSSSLGRRFESPNMSLARLMSERLVEASLMAGSRDNISVLVVLFSQVSL